MGCRCKIHPLPIRSCLLSERAPRRRDATRPRLVLILRPELIVSRQTGQVLHVRTVAAQRYSTSLARFMSPATREHLGFARVHTCTYRSVETHFRTLLLFCFLEIVKALGTKASSWPTDALPTLLTLRLGPLRLRYRNRRKTGQPMAKCHIWRTHTSWGRDRTKGTSAHTRTLARTGAHIQSHTHAQRPRAT